MNGIRCASQLGNWGGEAVRRAIKGCIRELLGIKNSVKQIIHLLHSNLLVELNNSFHFLLVYGVLPMCVLGSAGRADRQ
jgi:hypothetical protein